MLQSLLSFLYPPLCLHCRETVKEERNYLCPDCFGELELLDSKCRCPLCFAELESPAQKVCADCRQKKQPLHRQAAAFDYTGPAASLLYGLTNKKQPYLAKGMGAFLVMQWANLNWEKPDLITFTPRPYRQVIRVGYDHNELLAKEVSQLLDVPLVRALKYEDSERPLYRPKKRLDDKAVLLIADTTERIHLAAEGLMESYPSRMWGLALCYECFK